MTDNHESNQLTVTHPDAMALAGRIANHHAARSVFADYQSRKSINTILRHTNDLDAFTVYLTDVGLKPGDMMHDPEAWRGMTWGIVAAFVQWQLAQGYAVTSINGRLSTVKIYAGMATQAGTIDPMEFAMIQQIKSYKHSEALRLDESRLLTRQGTKKAEAVKITKAQAEALRSQPDTPQGRRDALMIGLLIGLGLRVGELVGLTVDCFDLKSNTLTFYRQKVDKFQTHRLTNGTLKAVKAYFDSGDAPAVGSIWRGSRKGGSMTGQGISERAVNKRIGILGAAVGLDNLSPHDLRHYWATQAARNGTPMDRLQDAGGWSSLAMPARYIEAGKIANDGVNLGDES